MKRKGSLLVLFTLLTFLLSGCSLEVLNPMGPAAGLLSETIIFSMLMMAGVLIVVYVLFVVILVKYRASKSSPDYEPPHEEGSIKLEIIWTLIPVIIVAILSVVTVKTTVAVEKPPEGYENQKPLIIYASSSNYKWHFSYPEQGVETVNYLNIPTNQNIEFRLYSYGPITSFWIPQLGGQKYAMSDMVTKLNLVAETPGDMLGKNSNFSGEGFAHMQFNVTAMPQAEFDEWVKEVKAREPALTEAEFDTLLATKFPGQKSYSSTHLEFRPAPEDHASHFKKPGKNEEKSVDKENHENHGTQNDQANEVEDHSNH
ncbi:cytochrome aa3 quinol oxidase subunit II [Paenibacillus sp. SC116]|uniref:cytochrome aa3 quinol oxidase subunit II n=1 Tax=Paenibacillus sp. SC116 TaxID=2968986 RepID=UPI00215A7714|nr:cytochrome aa3 quinol oxidase subunit II [Paenibacillus sp. SC116]MCR8845568.1 cytochrome aa3 quinol oxidase subunit II [Paenibacillus sp. SC116]